MKVFVQNLKCLAKHGVYEEERIEGRAFEIDLAAWVPDPSERDALSATLDYRQLAQIIKKAMEGPSVHLVETLAEDILRNVFEIDSVSKAEVTIRKRATGVPGEPEFVGVSLAQERNS